MALQKVNLKMPMRIYEFAKKHALANKELIALLKENGFDIESHMALLTEEAQAFLEKHIKAQEKAVPQKLVAPIEKPVTKQAEKATPSAVLGRDSIKLEKKIAPQVEHPASMAQEDEIIVEPMTVAEAADVMRKSVGEVILTLLKQGIVTTKNQVLTEKLVEKLAYAHGFKPVVRVEAKAEAVQQSARASEGQTESRLPVVVVVGHVDHGKTTLLDFIRKTRIAAKEKGGITQHLGAYEVHTDQGNLVFLDTPGHEAFSRMRVRGLKVADIAILVVAADDGVMPQTIEAIKRAKEVGLPIVVAINKVDKATPTQIEATKRGLAQHGLMPEEWGGDIVCMPISGKTGQGVDALLEVVVLQSQLMELMANKTIPARGCVLESKMEKGRGVVATVICHDGILRVGDYFIAGDVRGKVSSLIDSWGKRVMEVHPSFPALVAGFDALPQAGDAFEVVSFAEFKKERLTSQKAAIARQVLHENALNLIIKVDNASSKEALLGAIEKMSGKAFKEFYIIHAGIGSVTESDIILAADTKSIVYVLHGKIEANAVALMNKLQVTVKSFDIIYKLLEDLELLAEQGRPVKKVLRKIGEAVVLKVFDIKNLGVIAGAQVKTGRFSKDGKVVVWRGKYKVGEGLMKSLQRDKKAVKEVHAGFECAFMIDGFDAWEVDDRVECHQEVVEA